MVNGLSKEQIDRIGEAFAAGRKIEAINIYRAATGKGLKEAKDDIDTLMAELRKRNPDKYPAPKGCSSAALLLVAPVIFAASVL